MTEQIADAVPQSDYHFDHDSEYAEIQQPRCSTPTVQTTPLVREEPLGEAFPVAALGPLKKAVKSIQEITQAPIEIAAQSVLATTCLATQAHCNVQTLGGEKPISLFLITVAGSGERKSTCDTLAMKPILEFEKSLAAEHHTDRLKFDNELAIYEATKTSLVKEAKKDKDGARVDLHELGPPPQPPLLPQLVAPEPTLEGITKNLRDSRPSLGVFSDEAGQFLGGYAMNQENRLKTMAGFSKFWDGTPINHTRPHQALNMRPPAPETLLRNGP